MDDEKYSHILEALEVHYKDVAVALNYTSPFELLVATMLSAQCTDRQVNKVTKELFARYNTPAQFVQIPPENLERCIRSCGFYRVKSRNIINASRILIDKYEGQLPEDIDELIKLPGVGRKTANVVASNAFGMDAIAVDTHVFRVSNRLGLARSGTVEETENQLMKNIPRLKWSKAHNWLIWHGRGICKARTPNCHECFLSGYCNYYSDMINL